MNLQLKLSKIKSCLNLHQEVNIRIVWMLSGSLWFYWKMIMFCPRPVSSQLSSMLFLLEKMYKILIGELILFFLEILIILACKMEVGLSGGKGFLVTSIGLRMLKLKSMLLLSWMHLSWYKNKIISS